LSPRPATFDLRDGVDPTYALDPDDYIDWQIVDEHSQQVYGDVATWWTSSSPGVNYYRASMPAKHLPGRAVRLNETDVHPVTLRFRRQAGAAVWMTAGNVTRWMLMAEQHTQGNPVWIEADDNYTMPSRTSVDSTWLATRDKSGSDKASIEGHRKIVQSACVTGVIVSTPKLADEYRRLHGNVHVCRNSVDPDDWPDDPPHQPDGVLRVGWAGSTSHGYDLNDIRRALDWASRQPDVEVVLMGQLGLAGVNFTHVPWANAHADYRANLEQIDVMLCPLRSNPWSDCKSDVKALEATMAGACTVVSRTEPYRPWWEDDYPCYVADDAKGFLKAVKHLVAHRDEARETARLAREYVLGERVIAREIEQWRAALGQPRGDTHA